MSDNRRGDLLISGIGHYGGGTFNQARIDGKGSVDGDVECEHFSGNGIAKIRGNLRSKTAQVNGVTKIEGSFSANDLQVNGKARIGGSLTGEMVRLDGLVDVELNCEAERLIVNGRLRVEGLLNAESIEMSIQGPCRARTIGCSKLRVVKREWGLFSQLFGSIFPKFESRLTADEIEGDELRLEYTTARIVRGKQVWIGPGCNIGRIEYTESCNIDPAAKVRESQHA